MYELLLAIKNSRAPAMYRVDLEVRNSEVDLQGIVNHTNYFVYMEHARLKFLHDKLNINFSEWAKLGKNLILISTTTEFKKPLHFGEKFYILTEFMPESPVKFSIQQYIHNESDKLMVKAKFLATCAEVINGKSKLSVPREIQSLSTLVT